MTQRDEPVETMETEREVDVVNDTYQDITAIWLERPYQCVYCPLKPSFFSLNERQAHQKLKHADIPWTTADCENYAPAISFGDFQDRESKTEPESECEYTFLCVYCLQVLDADEVSGHFTFSNMASGCLGQQQVSTDE